MRIAILNTDYPRFLSELYASQPGLDRGTYEEQLEARNRSLFAVADFYSSALRKLGHEAVEFHLNNEPLQRAWGREHGVVPRKQYRLGRQFQVIPWIRSRELEEWRPKIIEAQIRDFRPDVIWNQAPDSILTDIVSQLRPLTKIMMAQQASPPLSEAEDWSLYDLAISSFPPRVEWFQEREVPAYLNRLAFGESVLEEIPKDLPKDLPITFIGSLSTLHTTRTSLLEKIAERYPLQVWGPTPDQLPTGSALRRAYRGTAWGTKMYELLARSQIAFNHHGNFPPFANNMRMYEATGVGALLLTDWKPDLHEMFEPGREVLAYKSDEECLEMIEDALKHPEKCAEIARAGQERTLREHTYVARASEVVEILKEFISKSSTNSKSVGGQIGVLGQAGGIH